jgi:hypothetical protein
MEPKKYSASALASVDYNPCRFASEKLVQKSEYLDKKGAATICGCMLHCAAKKLKEVPTPSPTTDFVYSKNFNPVINWKANYVLHKISPAQAQAKNSQNLGGDASVALRRLHRLGMELAQAVQFALGAKIQSAGAAIVKQQVQMLSTKIIAAAHYQEHADISNSAEKQKLSNLQQLVAIAKDVKHQLRGNKDQGAQFWQQLLGTKAAEMQQHMS